MISGREFLFFLFFNPLPPSFPPFFLVNIRRLLWPWKVLVLVSIIDKQAAPVFMELPVFRAQNIEMGKEVL